MNYITARKNIETIANADISDIDWLFCEILGVNRSQLNNGLCITKKQYKKLLKYAKKLAKNMPLSIALGKTEFLGLPIKVNKHILTPRQETEELADYVIKQIANKPNINVLDLCCGSGAVGIAIAKNTKAVVTCSDISKHAIKFTKANAKLNGVSIKTIKSDMLNNVWGNFNYIVCNPPYIKYGDTNVQTSVHKWEPHLALYAKENGYYFYKYLADKAKIYMLTGSKLCLEVGKDMAQNVADLFLDYTKTEIIKDMQNIDRFVIVTK